MVPVLLAVGLALAGAMAPIWAWNRWSGYVRRRGGAAPGRIEGVRYFAREAVEVVRAAGWAVRGAFRGGLRIPATVTGPPVLCIHGYTMNSTNFWGMRRLLERDGRPTRAVFLGFPGRAVARYTGPVVRALRELADAHRQVDVVAHSMGGIVLRVALRDHPELAAAVRRVVTLGTPHRGTAGARGMLAWLPEPRDLHRRSLLLADLPGFRELAPHAAVATFGGAVDVVVYPPETASLPGSRHFVVPHGHLAMVSHPAMARRVARFLAQDDADEA